MKGKYITKQATTESITYMLTENRVIELLEHHFIKNKCKIVHKANTNQRGVDLIAECNDYKYYIEAKGETSSKKNTNNFGKPFTSNQITNHIARAILTTIKIQIDTDENTSKYIIAFPDRPKHRQHLTKLINRLKEINIDIYLVSEYNLEILN